ncbi:uncharacterized protein LOC130741919 [Lotus japonicus]|uniref:uncharacterized protein LOC130741919 n=1 Tax=Lotus japonicus TaxID=34305 RepID=UPI00258A34CD|nr:uncharacterized protein LOC130741919 [Lotus japonicus]
MAIDIGRAYPSGPSGSSSPRWVCWRHSLQGSVVVNVEGSVSGSPLRGGFGGCIRSFDGNWIASFYGSKSDTDILLLELLGIFHGLSMAWDLGHRVVECQSNSLHVVELVLATPSVRHMYASLIWDINDLMDRPWRVWSLSICFVKETRVQIS